MPLVGPLKFVGPRALLNLYGCHCPNEESGFGSNSAKNYPYIWQHCMHRRDVAYCYPRESEGLCFYRRWFVCLFVTTITK